MNGRNLYRLKIIDRSGRFTYSVLRSIIFESQAETFVYPNPVADRLQIRVKDQDKVKQISIQDLNGRVIYSSDKVSDGGIDVTPIGNGIYFLRITDDEKSFLCKILINR